MSVTANITGIHHVAITANNVDATVRFYVEGLGYKRRLGWTKTWTIDRAEQILFDRCCELLKSPDGSYLMIFPGGKGCTEPLPAAVSHFSIQVQEVDAAYQQALNAGGRTHALIDDAKVLWDGKPTTWKQNSQPELTIRLAFVKGLNGELIELYSESLC